MSDVQAVPVAISDGDFPPRRSPWPNRWAAFTDDELKMHGSALAALKGEWRINLLQDAAREIDAELERRAT